MRIRCSDRVGVIKGLGRGQPRGVTGREGFEQQEEEEEKEEEDKYGLGMSFSPPCKVRGKILQFVVIGFDGGARREGGRPEKLKTNKTLLISNCYLRVEQSGEMPNKGFLIH